MTRERNRAEAIDAVTEPRWGWMVVGIAAALAAGCRGEGRKGGKGDQGSTRGTPGRADAGAPGDAAPGGTDVATADAPTRDVRGSTDPAGSAPAGPVTKDGFRDQIRDYVLATLRPLCPAAPGTCVIDEAEPSHPLVAWRTNDPEVLTVSVLMQEFSDEQIIDLNLSFCDLVGELGNRLDDDYTIQARIVNIAGSWGTNSQPFRTTREARNIVEKLERKDRLDDAHLEKLLGKPQIAQIDGVRMAIHKLDDGGEIRRPVALRRVAEVKLVDPRGRLVPVIPNRTIRPLRPGGPTATQPATPSTVRPGTIRVVPGSPTTTQPATPSTVRPGTIRVVPGGPTTIQPATPSVVRPGTIRTVPATPSTTQPTTPSVVRPVEPSR